MTAFLFTIDVSYHLLQRQVPTNGKADIDCYYNQLLICMKKAEETNIPSEHIRKKKLIWSMDPWLKSIKNKAILWLQIWSEYSHPGFGCVADLKHKTKTEHDKLNDDTMTKNCLPPSPWHKHYSSIFPVINYSV